MTVGKGQILRESMADDVDLWFCILVAVRYAMGRRSYAPSLVANTVKRYWPLMRDGDRQNIRRDVADEVRRAFESGHPEWLGDTCDQDTWMDLSRWMATQP